MSEELTGRELDIAVLVAMGFPKKKIFYHDWDTKQEYPHYIPSGKPKRTHLIDARPVLLYSTDHNAAFEVVAYMRKQGYSVVISAPLDWRAPWECCAYRPGNEDAPGHDADTAPLAICRAFLALTA